MVAVCCCYFESERKRYPTHTFTVQLIFRALHTERGTRRQTIYPFKLTIYPSLCTPFCPTLFFSHLLPLASYPRTPPSPFFYSLHPRPEIGPRGAASRASRAVRGAKGAR